MLITDAVNSSFVVSVEADDGLTLRSCIGIRYGRVLVAQGQVTAITPNQATVRITREFDTSDFKIKKGDEVMLGLDAR